MDLSSEQESYLHSVLDKELERFAASQQTHSRSTADPSFLDSPSVISKVSFAESQGVLSDIAALRVKVRQLENAVDSRLDKSGRSASVDLRAAPVCRSLSPQFTDTGALKAKLVEERRKQIAVQKENDRLRQRIGAVKVAEGRLATLRRDVESLRESFRKSEEIRLKQKRLISELQHSTDLESAYSHRT